MNILVAGTYRFSGRQVVASLLQAGHSVVCDFAHDTHAAKLTLTQI